MNISETVKRLRKEKGWTQARLAMEAHVSQQAISFIEQERNLPSADMIQALSEALGVSKAEIMGEDNQDDQNIVSIEEKKVLTAYRSLNRAGKKQLSEYLDYLLSKQEYKKEKKSVI